LRWLGSLLTAVEPYCGPFSGFAFEVRDSKPRGTNQQRPVPTADRLMILLDEIVEVLATLMSYAEQRCKESRTRLKESASFNFKSSERRCRL
jgi:hypothetical protein